MRGADENRCRVPRCRREADLDYLGRPICWRHWNQLCDDAPGLLKALGLANYQDCNIKFDEWLHSAGGDR